MENETQGQATPPAVGAPKKKPGFFGKIGALWKSGIKGKVICIAGALVILGIIGSCGEEEEGGDGGGGSWTFSDKDFYRVFIGFPKDEGVVYKHDGMGLKVMQATKKGNLVECEWNYYDRVVWVETKRRYEDDEPLDKGFYIRRGSMEYETALGAEKRVACYVEVSGKLLKKVQKQIEDEKAAAEAKARAAAEAKAKAKAEAEAAMPKTKAEVAAIHAGTRPGETTTITLPGGVTLEMVWCPPGTFTMGSHRDAHQVTLTEGFWMGKTEVTQAQWESVMGNNPSCFKGDNRPVESVSWNDCQQFCQKTGLQLPTEAQWEYACRAGNTGEYAGTGNLDDMGWYDDNSGRGTHPVETKQPNAWGLYDMHGNVWECCADWYGDYPSGAVTDPQGPSSGSGRVLRGGSWDRDASYCTSAYRYSYLYPSNAYNNIGFRLVRTLSE
ncbi:MAG: formylglycine-generating enzyme family protein [Kiritimatiellae bacterium]|nr:formylglycine-generating enzyme family protein [Kiritimatiellia bacterium]